MSSAFKRLLRQAPHFFCKCLSVISNKVRNLRKEESSAIKCFSYSTLSIIYDLFDENFNAFALLTDLFRTAGEAEAAAGAAEVGNTAGAERHMREVHTVAPTAAT